MPPIDLPFTKVLARLELGTWTPLSRSNAERLRNENTRGLYEIQVRRFTPRSYKWEPLTSDYEHRARAVFRARKIGEELKPAAVEEETRLLHGCAECGKTSTPDSMWALYCVKCVEDKIAPALSKHSPEVVELLDKIDRKAEAGLCYFTLSSAREFLKDIREIVATAQGKEYTR